MRSLNNISAYDLQDQGLNTLASFASGTNMIFADQVENNSAAQQELDTLIETMQQNASSIRSVTLSDLEAFKASL